MSEAGRSETAPPPLEIRVGSATNALQPVLTAERPVSAGLAQWLALALVAGAVVAADQLTKQLVVSTVGLNEHVAVVGPFSIRHVHNSGIAFGLFSSATGMVAFLTVVAVAAMLVVFHRSARRHGALPVALGLVLGGSLANLLDRVRLGYVVDFLDLEFWPAFNLADTAIVVGVALLFLGFVAADRTSPRVGNAPFSRSGR